MQEQTDAALYARLWTHFASMYSEYEPVEIEAPRRPLLAHYTSVEVFESIARANEIWFSNPLFMDDVEEIRFGITRGLHHFLANDALTKAAGTDERRRTLNSGYEHYYEKFANDHVMDLYVLCLSEHRPTEIDGRLSMWRGYGGNGKGVAIVLNAAKIKPVIHSPLIIGKVHYGSAEERDNWIVEKLNGYAKLIGELPFEVATNKLYLIAHAIFERIRLFSLFSKHSGFIEEQEWRVVYLKERDSGRGLDGMLHYAVGKRGVEPKLKFKLVPNNGITSDDFSFDDLVHQIILGPSVATPLARAAVCRMLERVGRGKPKDKVVSSNIPFRPGHLG